MLKSTDKGYHPIKMVNIAQCLEDESGSGVNTEYLIASHFEVRNDNVELFLDNFHEHNNIRHPSYVFRV